MRRSIAFITKISLALMVFGLASPIPNASSTTVPMVTKTFTVHDRNDQPIANALVQIQYFDTATNFNDNTYSSITLTDSSGVASVSIPKNAQYAEAQVEPALGDISNAIYTSIPYGVGALDSTTDSSIAVRLLTADLSLKIVQPNGSDAPLTTSFRYPLPSGSDSSTDSWTIRTGSFGIALNPSIAIGAGYVLGLYPPLTLVNVFSRSYGLKVTGTRPNLAPVVFANVLNNTPLTADSNGTYTLTLDAGNIEGQLKAADGSNFSFPSGLGQAYLQIQKLNADGSFDYSPNTYDVGALNYGPIDSSGHFYSRIHGLLAGKYAVIVFPGPPTTIPVFRTDLWVNSSGGFSLTENGTFSTSEPYLLNLTVPTANLVLHTVQPGTNIADAGYLDISKGTSGTFVESDFSKSIGSFALPDGNYVLTFNSTSGGDPGIFNLTILSGAVTLTDSTNHTLTPASDGSYSISTPAVTPPNFLFHLQDSAGNVVSNIYVNACLLDSNLNCASGAASHSISDGSGNGGLAFDNGSFRIMIYPPNDSTLAQVNYQISVVNGVVTVVNPSLTPDGTGRVSLIVPSTNLHLQIVDPTNTGVPLPNATAYICNGHPGGCQSFGFNPAGIENFYLPDGLYSMVVEDFTPSTPFVRNNYQVSVTNGVISFIGQTPTIDSATNRILVSPSNSNFLLTVQESSTALAIPGAYVSFCTLVNGQTTSCTGSNQTDSSGNTAAHITDGTYKLIVNPGANSSLSTRTYDATVSGSGMIVNIIGANFVAGRWIVSPAQPNVSGTFADESGQPLTFSSNNGVSIQLQKRDTNQNWIYQDNNAWRNSSTWGLNLTAAGTYRVVATPYGFSDYATTFSNSFVFDPAVTQQSIPIIFKTSNLKLLIHNPLDNSLLRGGYLQIEQLFPDHSTWISNSNIDYSNPGLSSAFLGDGNFRITVNPPQGSDSIVGLAQKVYLVTVSSNGTSVVVTDGTTPLTADSTTHRFSLAAASANITARIVDVAGTPITLASGVSISVNVQKWNSATGNWENNNQWAPADNDGFVGVSIHEAGKYRLRIYTSGRDDLVSTNSSDFTITSLDSSIFTKSFGDIALNNPSILVKVILPGGGLAGALSGIQITKNGEWFDWASPVASGVVPISLPDAGSYEFIVEPAYDGSSGQATAKSYAITAVKDVATGVVTASADGVAAVNGVYSLPLGAATLSGSVRDPRSNLLANSQVIAIDTVTNQEMWQYSVSSNPTGAWSMSLPAGTYKLLAKTPWGNSQFGNSDLFGDFTVGANGVATLLPSGITASTVTLTLKDPTWSGVVQSPDGLQVISRANICYRIDGTSSPSCLTTDAQGRFAISAPAGFLAFDANSYLQIQEGQNPQYSQLNFQGATAVLGALGLSNNSIVLRLPAPNVAVTVTAGGNPVPNAWVNFERDGFGWFGGGVTDSQGVARATIPNPELGFIARAEVDGSSFRGTYAPTRAVFPATALTSGVYLGQLALSTPNIRGILREPSSGGAVLATFSNIYLSDDSNGSFISSVNVDSTGFFSLNAPVPTTGVANYTLTVNPRWDGASSNTSQKYELAIDSSGGASVTLKSSGQSVATEIRDGVAGTIYSFSLAAPSVVGTVYGSNGSTPLANSWINVINAATGQYVYVDGSSSRSNGGFSLPLPDGTYDLQANAPWGSTNISSSSLCRVVVSGSQVTSGATCVQPDKTIHLALRAPNLTFTVADGNGVPVPYASAYVWNGSWHSGAQSDQNGLVSLFIDSDGVKAATGATDGTTVSFHIVVDPPYGDSSTTRWQCDSTQAVSNCLNIPSVTIGQTYPSTALSAPLLFPTPNVKVRVMLPDGTTNVGIGAWVSIYQILDPTNPSNKNWITGGNTDTQGYAAFTLDSTLTNLVVEVNPPSVRRSTVASESYTNNSSGYSVTDLNNHAFNLGLPNLKLTVKGAAGEVNKWGGVAVEKLVSGNSYSWLGNYNLDELGKLSLLLPSSGTFRLTTSAGSGSSGAQTTCTVTTDGNGVVSTSIANCPDGLLTSDSLAATLGSGNVVGTVLAPGSTPVEGATVYANVHNAPNESTALVTTTTATGRFGLNLDPTLQWDLRILPRLAAPGQVQLANLLSGPVVSIHPAGSVSDLGSITLSVI